MDSLKAPFVHSVSWGSLEFEANKSVRTKKNHCLLVLAVTEVDEMANQLHECCNCEL